MSAHCPAEAQPSRTIEPGQSRKIGEDAGLALKQNNAQIGFTVLTGRYKYRDFSVPYKIAIWYPTDALASRYDYKIGPSLIQTDLAQDAALKSGTFPIIFYSHGATGAGTSSFFLCEMLARNNYIVVAADYLDMVCVARIDESIAFDPAMRMRANLYIDWLRQFGLNKMAAEELKLHSYRPRQLQQVIDLMVAKNADRQDRFFNAIDVNKIGLVGHSFGAWTSLLLSGADPAYSNKGVKAVVSLSGPVNDHIYSVNSKNDLALIKIPILFEYGELEPAQGRKDDKALLFDRANRPKGIICIKGADHLSFSGGVKGEHRLAREYIDNDEARCAISQTTLDFFDYYLKGDASKDNKLDEKRPGVIYGLFAR